MAILSRRGSVELTVLCSNFKCENLLSVIKNLPLKTPFVFLQSSFPEGESPEEEAEILIHFVQGLQYTAMLFNVSAENEQRLFKSYWIVQWLF